MNERERLLRSLAKAEDAAFKNGLAYLRERERSEKLEARLPEAPAKRPRGRPRGTLDGLASPREIAELYRAASAAVGRDLTEREFADHEKVSLDTVKARLRRFNLTWPPI